MDFKDVIKTAITSLIENYGCDKDEAIYDIASDIVDDRRDYVLDTYLDCVRQHVEDELIKAFDRYAYEIIDEIVYEEM